MKIVGFFAFLIVLFSAGMPAQQPVVLSLEKATSLAMEKNLAVIQAQNNVESAQSSVLAAYGNYLPTMSASGSWYRNQNDRASSIEQSIAGQNIVFPASFSVTNNFSTGLSLNYTVFDGFAREANFNRASANATSSEQEASRTRQAIVFQVESSYLNVLRQGQLVRVSEENLRRDRRQLERITESNRVGALSLADVYRQQSQVASDELNVITAQNNFDKAKADLVALIGLDVSQGYDFSDPAISATIDQAEIDATIAKYGDFTALTQRALSSRPDYGAAREALNAAESGVTASRAGYFPSVSASAGYSLSSSEFSSIRDNKNINWGISLRWNIFDAFRTNQGLQSAIALRRNSEVALMQAERSIGVEVKKVLLDLEAARKQLDVSQKGLRSAQEDRRIAEERYNLGAGTLLDLLTANAGLVNAEANTVNATYFYFITKRNLEYVLGERTY